MKETLIQSVRSTWASIHDFARAHTVDVDVMGESEVDKGMDDTDSVGTDSEYRSTLIIRIHSFVYKNLCLLEGWTNFSLKLECALETHD